MKLKIDENLPAEFDAILAEAGFEALTVTDEVLSGAQTLRFWSVTGLRRGCL